MTFEPSDGIAQDIIMLLCQIQPHVLRSNLENHFHWTQSDTASRNDTWISVAQGELGLGFTSVLCGDAGRFSGPELISDGLL